MGGVRQRSARYWRLNAGLTVDELAVKARVSRPSITRLERGEGKPFGSILLAVASVLGVAPSLIALDGDGDGDGERVSLTDCRDAIGLTVADVASALTMPIAVVRRAESGAAVHPGHAKRLSDFYGVRVTDWYPESEDRAAA